MKNGLQKTSPGAHAPVLSLVLCSRNDQYMGNSLWRLCTTLNYTAQRISELGRMRDVEIIVSDWGSSTPLRDAVNLNAEAAQIVSFLHIPKEIALPLQKESPFPEVLAVNAAARRARGRFIGRIDQDTLVGARFFDQFLEMCSSDKEFKIEEKETPVRIPLDRALMFSTRRGIPYRFVVRYPSETQLKRLIDGFGPYLPIANRFMGQPIVNTDVGIWMFHRDIWFECGGYDERLIFMNEMDPEMGERLGAKYKLIDLGEVVGYDFFHLDHYHPLNVRTSSAYRKVNARPDPKGINPNGDGWGLRQYDLPLQSADAKSTTQEGSARRQSYLRMVLGTGLRIAGDNLFFLARLPLQPLQILVSSIAGLLFLPYELVLGNFRMFARLRRQRMGLLPTISQCCFWSMTSLKMAACGRWEAVAGQFMHKRGDRRMERNKNAFPL
jgi:hypothetical protein